MKTYILKLKTASTTNYSLYDGTTLVSDADLTTLFATEGEAYFTIDLNSLTPTNLTSLTIVNSSDTAVMTNTGLTLVEGKNFKGEWGNSATSFTSFTQLSAYGLDESQLGQLASLAKSGKIRTLTTADYNWPTTGEKSALAMWTLDTGVYVVGEGMAIQTKNSGGGGSARKGTVYIVSKNSSSDQIMLSFSQPLSGLSSVSVVRRANDGSSVSTTMVLEVVDNLTTPNAVRPLSANQGYVLKDLIDSLVIKGSGAPTTSTVGTVGMLYEDTTNGKLYQCTDATNPYVWAEVGGGVNVVQTTGTSTTDVMSQAAVTNMIFPEGSESTHSNVLIGSLSSTPANLGAYNIRIGSGISTANNEQEAVVIGHGAGLTTSAGNSVSIGHSAAAKAESVAIGHSAESNSSNTVAIGHSAQAFTNDAIAIGSNIRVSNAGSVVIGNGYQNNTQYTTRANEFCVHASATANQPMVHSNVDTPELATDAANKRYVDHSHTIATSAPDNTTVGVLGQLYTDTTGMHTYQCTAIDDTDPSNLIYTWTQRW